MKNRKFFALGVVLSSALGLAACSTPAPGTQASSTQVTSSAVVSTSKESATKALPGEILLEQLKEAASDDAKAKEVWKEIFSNTALANSDQLELAGDGEIYEYQTAQDSEFVKDDFLYDTASENKLTSKDGVLYSAQYRVIDDSYQNFETGAAFVTRTGDKPVTFIGELSSTSDDTIAGTIKEVTDPEFTDQSLRENLVYGSMMTGGYVRAVDPVNNASLYDFDFQKSGDETILTMKVKDLDAFHKKATETVITSEDGRPVLILNEITNETYTLKFDKFGNLKESAINTFHALRQEDETLYVNVRSEMETERLDEKDSGELIKSLDSVLNEVAEGKLKAGDQFSISND